MLPRKHDCLERAPGVEPLAAVYACDTGARKHVPAAALLVLLLLLLSPLVVMRCDLLWRCLLGVDTPSAISGDAGSVH